MNNGFNLNCGRFGESLFNGKRPFIALKYKYSITAVTLKSGKAFSTYGSSLPNHPRKSRSTSAAPSLLLIKQVVSTGPQQCVLDLFLEITHCVCDSTL